MVELDLTCRMCGHEEHGFASYAEAVKERMQAHLEVFHPDYADKFDIAVRGHLDDNVALYTP